MTISIPSLISLEILLNLLLDFFGETFSLVSWKPYIIISSNCLLTVKKTYAASQNCIARNEVEYSIMWALHTNHKENLWNGEKIWISLLPHLSLSLTGSISGSSVDGYSKVSDRL